MELWDVYDINRYKTGRVIDRHSNERLADGEVIDAKWVTIDEFEKMCDNKEIVPTIDFTREDYEKLRYKNIISITKIIKKQKRNML